MTKGIFITGTDTGVGKTIVTAGILHLLISKGFKASYFKAALSGTEENGVSIPSDTSIVCKVSELNEKFDDITPYMYKTPVSPHLASKLENRTISKEIVMEKFKQLKQKYDYIVAEGSGGIVCPLIDNKNEIYLLEDLIKDLKMDVIVVARAGLGTINHTVLTVKYIKSLGIGVKGIIINGYKNNVMCNDNIELIKKYTRIPMLGVVDWIDDLNFKQSSGIDKVKGKIGQAINFESVLNSMCEI